MMILKKCCKCKKEKELEKFSLGKGKFSKASSCKDCSRKVVAEWRKNNQDRNENLKYANWKSKIKRNFGISEKSYLWLLNEQEGVCAICKQEDVLGKRLAVDHNHETGEVRGLLCSGCNRGLGYFSENCSNLLSATKYLSKTKLIA